MYTRQCTTPVELALLCCQLHRIWDYQCCAYTRLYMLGRNITSQKSLGWGVKLERMSKCLTYRHPPLHISVTVKYHINKAYTVTVNLLCSYRYWEVHFFWWIWQGKQHNRILIMSIVSSCLATGHLLLNCPVWQPWQLPIGWSMAHVQSSHRAGLHAII